MNSLCLSSNFAEQQIRSVVGGEQWKKKLAVSFSGVLCKHITLTTALHIYEAKPGTAPGRMALSNGNIVN